MNILRKMARTVLTPGRRRMWTAVAAVAGGALVMAGTLLPWITLFAGLHPYPGIMGLWGKLLFAGGAVVTAAGAGFLLTDHRTALAACYALGPILLGASVVLLLRQRIAYHELVASQPMMVPGVGPGLYVVLAGAVLVSATLAMRWRPVQRSALK